MENIKKNKSMPEMKINRGSLIYRLPEYPKSIKKPEPLNLQIISDYEKIKNTLDNIQTKIDDLKEKKNALEIIPKILLLL